MSGPGLVTSVSPETIVQAAASQKHLPVGEDLQQRQCFSVSDGCQPGTVSEAVQEGGLAVQVRVLQAGPALWLPARQGCDWPVDVMLEVAVLSADAVPGGVDVTVVADAVTAAQRVVLAHGGPLPLRLQRALAVRSSRLGTTAFSGQQCRRVAHMEVPEGGTWVREHFVFPVLSFQKHSNMHPLSLMFAAAAETTAEAPARAHIAAATLLPRTVSMRSSAEVYAALRVLSLPEDVFESICAHRNAADSRSARSGHTSSAATTVAAAASNADGPLEELPPADAVDASAHRQCKRMKRERSSTPPRPHTRAVHDLECASAARDCGASHSTQSIIAMRIARATAAKFARASVHGGHCGGRTISAEDGLRFCEPVRPLHTVGHSCAREPGPSHRPMLPDIGTKEGVGCVRPEIEESGGSVPRVPLTLPSLEACEALLAQLLCDGGKGVEAATAVAPAAAPPPRPPGLASL